MSTSESPPANSITVGEMERRMEHQFFPERSSDSLIRDCRERELGLKQYANICADIIQQLRVQPAGGEMKLSHWKKRLTIQCIRNLGAYLINLVEELDEDRIRRHCIKRNSGFALRLLGPFDPDLSVLMQNSYYGAIVADIYWISELSVREALDISVGRLNFEVLAEKLPGKLAEIESLNAAVLSTLPSYSQYNEAISEALNCAELGHHRSLNLIVLTTIEGMVRHLGIRLANHHGINVRAEEYNSLDKFLRSIPWPKDYTIRRTTLSLMNGSNLEFENGKRKYEGDPLGTTTIDFKERLDFLRRRFKEHRDLVMHGQETEYHKPWRSFVNLCALGEVVKCIKYYHGKYPTLRQSK